MENMVVEKHINFIVIETRHLHCRIMMIGIKLNSKVIIPVKTGRKFTNEMFIASELHEEVWLSERHNKL